MFTGLVEQVGRIQSIEERDGYKVLTLTILGADVYAEKLGDSIAVNGCCLTVTRRSETTMSFDASHETLARTSLGQLRNGSLVNLERALKAGDRLGGHMVAGHVDAVATVRSIDQLPGGWNIWVTLGKDLARYVIPKGSIALDGISLTINEVKDEAQASHVRLTLIPATIEGTNVQTWTPGGIINVEVDMVGKYLERMALPHFSK
ncbi:MAG TPA: riboflavin synthase [Oligoflexus sp.]|uniref:riboflavin synthase n=1 Tax=Oligoflexus sp. TaxID=1971216 RepID=UPI002D800907|nr:riboflavin synthase [Oligoflexus sp.]HET9237046.1 riboflavin synthase [Oligoflexus sp.]